LQIGNLDPKREFLPLLLQEIKNWRNNKENVMKEKIKIKDLVGDLTFKEIKSRKWKHPVMWINGEKIIFKSYAISSEEFYIIRIAAGRSWNSYLGRLMTYSEYAGGYFQVTLFDEKNRKISAKIHRLVYETFVGKIDDGKEINHKDGNKQNNSLSNLEIVSRSENIKHAFKIGLKTHVGEHNPMFDSYHSEEAKRKIGVANSGEKNGMFRKIFSEEEKKAKRERVLGNKNPMYGKRGELSPLWGNKHSFSSKVQMSKSMSSNDFYLNEKNIKKIFELYYLENKSYKKIADFFKTSKGRIYHLIKGHNWNPENLSKQELAEKYVWSKA
jgi:predicted DNA-binding protein YlxM (UPF0122 family)